MLEPVNYHFFLHVPKTAGTSIRELLDARFDPRRCIPTIEDMRRKWGGVYPTIPELLKLPDDAWRTAQLLRGHYYYQLAGRFPRAPICLIMLREPVARSISTIRHLMRKAPLFRTKTLRELIFSEEFMLRNVADMQTKMLAIQFNLDDPKTWPRDTNGRINLTEQDLNRAKQVLRSFQFIGLQEQFEDSIALLFDLFGWTMPAKLPRSNVGNDRFDRDLDAETLAEVARYNQLDQQLYKLAQQLFASRKAKFDAREDSP